MAGSAAAVPFGRFAARDAEKELALLAPAKEVDVGEGLPFEITAGFLEAAAADFSVRGRGVEVEEEGRAEPAYPVEDRSAGREVLERSAAGLIEPAEVGVGVVLWILEPEPEASSSAFLLERRADGRAEGVVGLSPLMEASSWPIFFGMDMGQRQGRWNGT